MKRRFRLTRAEDFKRVRRFGKSYAHPLVVLVTLPGEELTVQVGVAASRSVGKAVERNRAKRQLRSIIDEVFPGIKSGWKIVVLARKPIVTSGHTEIRTALVSLMKEAGLLVEAENGCKG